MPVTRESGIQVFTVTRLYIKNYLITNSEGTRLNRYLPFVHPVKGEARDSLDWITSNIFFYRNNDLIKIQEMTKQGNQVMRNLNWYASEGKYLLAKPAPDPKEQRAKMLFNLSKTIIKQALKN